MYTILYTKFEVFQFTLPCGERHYETDLKKLKQYISIHAPVWGATYIILKERTDTGYFNSRSRVGSDRLRNSCIY